MTSLPKLALADPATEVALLRATIDEATSRVLTSGRFILGPEVEALEKEAASYLGAAHAVGVSNGTDAIVAALQALGVGPGHEVITTSFSFFATAGAIVRTGATPVFCDIDPKTFNLDPDRVAESVTGQTRAILAVHIFGQSADLERLSAIARRAGVPLVEDAAQGFGAEHRGKKFSAGSAAATYSFFPAKVLGACGDGGMVATNDAALAQRIRRLREHGASAKNVHDETGGNYRLHPMQAAILRVKLPHLDQWIARRRSNADRYRARLEGHPHVEVPSDDPVGRHIYAQLTLRAERRDDLAKHLQAAGIGSAVYYPVILPEQPALTRFVPSVATFPHATRAAAEVLSVPVHPHLPDGSVDRVCDAILRFYG